jgi:MraZ protein
VEKNVRKCKKVGNYFIILQNIYQATEMAGFFGTYSAKIDDKGRVVIPSAIKNAVPADQLEFIIRKDMYSDCLEMYTMQEWTLYADSVRAKLDIPFDEEDMMYWRTFMADTTSAIPDPKLGRISVPKDLLDKCGIIKEVVFFCLGYKIEIWAKEALEGSRLSTEQFKAKSKSLAAKK